MELPDCVFCDSHASLKPVCADGPLVWVECSVCSKTCLVKEGRVVHPPRVVDVSGLPVTGP